MRGYWLSIRRIFGESPGQKVERMLYQAWIKNTLQKAKDQGNSSPQARFPSMPQGGRWIDLGFKASKGGAGLPWGTDRNEEVFRPPASRFSETFYGIPKCDIVFNFEDEYEPPFNNKQGLSNVVVMTYPSSSEALSTFEILRKQLMEDLGPPDSTKEISFWCVPSHLGLIWDSPYVRASLHIGSFKGECPMTEFRIRRKKTVALEVRQEQLVQENVISCFDI